jgi:uncharacterized protein YcfJ
MTHGERILRSVEPCMSVRFFNRSAASMVFVALCATTAASAQYRGDYERGDYEPEYDYARVVRVEPIVDVVERPVSREQCWNEPVTRRVAAATPPARRARAPAVLGGIVGGVINDTAGRDAAAATVAGVARNSPPPATQRREARTVTTHERRCETRTDYRRDERITGYDVAYRYRGRVYRTVMDYDPGRRIRVEVAMQDRYYD